MKVYLIVLFGITFSRELIYKGETGGMVVFDDRPNYWDAWGTFIPSTHPFEQSYKHEM